MVHKNALGFHNPIYSTMFMILVTHFSAQDTQMVFYVDEVTCRNTVWFYLVSVQIKFENSKKTVSKLWVSSAVCTLLSILSSVSHFSLSN